MNELPPRVANDATWMAISRNNYYLCRTSRRFGLSPLDNDRMLYTEDEKDELIDINLTIYRMVDIYSKGAYIAVLDLSKTVEIYNLIIQHLTNHLDNILNSRFTLPKVPLEDLEEMQTFAETLSPIASKYGTIDTSPLPKVKANIGSRLRGNVSRTGEVPVDLSNPDTRKYEKRSIKIVDNILMELTRRGV